MKKRSIDRVKDKEQYFTPEHIVDKLIGIVENIIPKDEISEIIEPSAGAGAFLKRVHGIMPIGYDLEPLDNKIIRANYLETPFEYKKGRMFIGNPPFGKSSNIAIKFLKKMIHECDYIAMVLPRGFYMWSNTFYEFDLIHSEAIECDFVLPDGNIHNKPVKTVINIYKRPEHGLNKKRIDVEMPFSLLGSSRCGIAYPFRNEKVNGELCRLNCFGSIGRITFEQDRWCGELIIIPKYNSNHKMILEFLENMDIDMIRMKATTGATTLIIVDLNRLFELYCNKNNLTINDFYLSNERFIDMIV